MLSRILSITVILNLIAFCAHSANYLNDGRFEDAIKSNNIWRKDWTSMKSGEIPEQMKQFATIELDTDKKLPPKERQLLIPSEILCFKNDGTFTFFKMNCPGSVNTIEGAWKVQDSMLVLTLDRKYGNVPGGTEFRYFIQKLIAKENGLKLSGTSYPDINKIADTSDNPMSDLQHLLETNAKLITEKTAGK